MTAEELAEYRRVQREQGLSLRAPDLTPHYQRPSIIPPILTPSAESYFGRGNYGTQREYNTAGVGIYGDANIPGQLPRSRGFETTPEEQFRFDQGNRNLGVWAAGNIGIPGTETNRQLQPAYTQPSIIPAASPAPSASGVGGFGASRQQELPYWMKRGGFR